MDKDGSTQDTTTPTTPIPINARGRRASITASIPALSTSPTSPLVASIKTPTSPFSQRFMNGSSLPHTRSSSDNGGTSPSSPLAYFLGGATSPVRTSNPSGTGGFPFGSKATSAIDEDEESPPGAGSIGLFGVGAHTRRGSWAQSGVGIGAFGSSGAPIAKGKGNERSAGVLRRLSLGNAFQRPSLSTQAPSPPPPSAAGSPIAPTLSEPRGRKARAATLSVNDPSKKRGISPMGERLLKGHFDGF